MLEYKHDPATAPLLLISKLLQHLRHLLVELRGLFEHGVVANFFDGDDF